MNAAEGLVPVADVACLLNCSTDHVGRLIHHGELCTVMVNGATYVRATEVRALNQGRAVDHER
jgi:hypothetical protein